MTQLNLQEIKDQIAPHLNLEELQSLLCFIEIRIEDVERHITHKPTNKETLKDIATEITKLIK